MAQLEWQDALPHYWPLSACPTDPTDRESIDRRPADAHIAPLWYPEGEHGYVEQILAMLSE